MRGVRTAILALARSRAAGLFGLGANGVDCLNERKFGIDGNVSDVCGIVLDACTRTRTHYARTSDFRPLSRCTRLI